MQEIMLNNFAAVVQNLYKMLETNKTREISFNRLWAY